MPGAASVLTLPDARARDPKLAPCAGRCALSCGRCARADRAGSGISAGVQRAHLKPRTVSSFELIDLLRMSSMHSLKHRSTRLLYILRLRAAQAQTDARRGCRRHADDGAS